MTLLNHTAHQIDLFHHKETFYDAKKRRHILLDQNSVPFDSFPTLGMLNVKYANNIEDLDGLPVYKKVILDIDTLPENPEGLPVVVSSVYANCARLAGIDTTNMYIIANSVYDKYGTVVGCLGIHPVI